MQMNFGLLLEKSKVKKYFSFYFDVPSKISKKEESWALSFNIIMVLLANKTFITAWMQSKELIVGMQRKSWIKSNMGTSNRKFINWN